MPMALPLFSGMGYGYVLYDCAHYAVHSPKLVNDRGGWLQRVPIVSELFKDLRMKHMDHHFRDHTMGYGISSTFFDVLLGTSTLWNNRE